MASQTTMAHGGDNSPAQAMNIPTAKPRKRDLYADLQKIEERGKRRTGFTFFKRKK